MEDTVFRALTGLSRGTALEACVAIEQPTRVGYLVLFQFQIENLLRNILRTLKTSPLPQAYYAVAQQLLEALSIGDRKTKLDVLDTPALLRNSLHSNGIHHGYRGKSKRVKIDDVEFVFEHGKKVSCAGWGHIVLALDAVLSVIEEILKAPEIQALSGPIRDQYAWEELGEKEMGTGKNSEKQSAL